MTPEQKSTAEAIVNIFETGRVAGNYASITVAKGDRGHLSYGRSQASLGSGNLGLLIKAYCERPDAQFARQLRPFLPRLLACDVSLDRDLTLREILAQAATEDPTMRSEQDAFFDRQYFAPAQKAASSQGVTLPLGITVVYDSFIQGGFRRVVLLTGSAVGGLVTEKDWIQKYIEARRGWLLSLPGLVPKTVYRMDAFQTLVGDNAWELPLNLTVRGLVISPETLREPAHVVRAAAVDTAEPGPGRILYLTSPYLRGQDVHRLQMALASQGLSSSFDGIYGPFTAALVRKFQIERNLHVDGVVGPSTRTALGI